MSSSSGSEFSNGVDNYSDKMGWTIGDCLRQNRNDGIRYYAQLQLHEFHLSLYQKLTYHVLHRFYRDGGIHLSHPTLKEKLTYFRKNCIKMNCSEKGFLWQAADMCSKLMLISVEHPELNWEANDLKIQLMGMYVSNHEEFLRYTFQTIQRLLDNLEWRLLQVFFVCFLCFCLFPLSSGTLFWIFAFPFQIMYLPWGINGRNFPSTAQASINNKV